MQEPTGDLQRRLLQNGGRVAPGLFRRPNRALQQPKSAPDVFGQLRALLRDLVNVNVRKPSHVDAPFRAQSWLHQLFYANSATTAADVAVPFNGNAAVPNGWLAVIRGVQFFAAIDGSQSAGPNPWAVPADRFLRVKVNGRALPGMAQILPSATLTGIVTTAAPAVHRGCTIPPPELAPVTLRPGDRLTYDQRNSGTVGAGTYTTFVQLFGYLYPIELDDDDGVRGTLADRDDKGTR